MSKSQNTKNEQLTEQWKKGELPEGFYWVKIKEEIANYPILAECVRRYEYYDIYSYFPEYEDSITSVLAPVPSYEEWQALNQNLDSTMQTNKALYKKLAEVKELLKEIRDSIAESQLKLTPEGFELITEIVAKIKEALK